MNCFPNPEVSESQQDRLEEGNTEEGFLPEEFGMLPA